MMMIMTLKVLMVTNDAEKILTDDRQVIKQLL